MFTIGLALFTLVLLPSSITALCPSGCSCISDSTCQYYCQNGFCQPAIQPYAACSGYYVHRQECTSGYYCESTSRTCRPKIPNGSWCTDSYVCSSGYCDYGTNTCRTSGINFSWTTTVLVPSIVVTTLIIIVIVVLVVRRQRRLALSYYRQPYVVLPTNTTCSYPNSYLVGETAPPPYPGVHSTSTSYQGSTC